MKIDLFYEIEKAKEAWGENHEYELLKETLAQAELADRVGFDCWWEVEHHAWLEGSYSAAPEVVLAAIAQRTKRMRLGHGIVLAPYNFNHPIRVAERAATLDLLSDGRVEVGFGRSTPPEWRLFGIDEDDTQDQMLETMRMVPKMWAPGPFSWESKDFSISEHHIVPKPLQKPHPPLWQAATHPPSWERAGSRGVGVLGVTLLQSVEAVAGMVEQYRAAIKSADPVGEFVNDQAAVFTFVHCAPTTQEGDRPRGGGGRGLVHQRFYRLLRDPGDPPLAA